MPITSASTLAEVQAAYVDNAGYAAVGDLAMAHAFITAARVLLMKLPQESSSKDGGVRFQVELIAKEIDRAESWISAGNGVSTANPTAGPPAFTRVSTQFFNR